MNKKEVLRCSLVAIAIVLIGGLGVGLTVHFELTGWPWEHATARKQLEAYLQKRFSQKMVITDEYIDFKFSDHSFIFTVHPEGSDYWFQVYQLGRGSPDFQDNYYTSVWETEARMKIQHYLQKIYPVKNLVIVRGIEFDFSQFPQWGISQAPSFVDLQTKVKVFRYDLTIYLYRDFDHDHQSKENENVFRVIQFLKESDLVPDSLEINFTSEDGETIKSIESTSFFKDEFKAITSVQTMIAVLKNRKPILSPGQKVTPRQDLIH